MTPRSLRHLALLLTLPALALTGCGSDNIVRPDCVRTSTCGNRNAINGAYNGIRNVGGQNFSWRLVIPQTVSGSFNLTGTATEDFGARRTATIAGSGNYNHPAITYEVTLTDNGVVVGSGSFSGTVAETRDSFTTTSGGTDTTTYSR